MPAKGEITFFQCPSEVEAGKTFPVNVKIRNVGEVEGYFKCECWVGGSFAGWVEGPLPPGYEMPLTFNPTMPSRDVTVKAVLRRRTAGGWLVDDEESRLVKVKRPTPPPSEAKGEIYAYKVPTVAVPGKPVECCFTVKNVGGSTGWFRQHYQVDGVEGYGVDVSIPPEGTFEFTFKFTMPERKVRVRFAVERRVDHAYVEDDSRTVEVQVGTPLKAKPILAVATTILGAASLTVAGWWR